jgi:8-oxo-dGTP pyrophosphatase MutT (NUDIX family)
MSAPSSSLASRIDLALVRRALGESSTFAELRRVLDPSSYARAGVVVPVVFGAEPHALVVVRSSTLAEHAGELGFPGGKPLTADESVRDAAFRELEEELGFERAEVEELGQLSSVPVVTGKYLITPFVARISPEASPELDGSEIEGVIRVPLAAWLDGTRRFGGFSTEWRGAPYVIPHFHLEGHVLYGASALIFFELLERMSRALGVTLPEPVIEKERPWGERYPE